MLNDISVACELSIEQTQQVTRTSALFYFFMKAKIMSNATLAAPAVTSSTTKAALKVSTKTKVVLNDNAKQTKNTVNVFNFVSALAFARKQWQQDAYTKSNNELYKLLAECYAQYLAMCADNAKAKQQKERAKSCG